MRLYEADCCYVLPRHSFACSGCLHCHRDSVYAFCHIPCKLSRKCDGWCLLQKLQHRPTCKSQPTHPATSSPLSSFSLDLVACWCHAAAAAQSGDDDDDDVHQQWTAVVMVVVMLLLLLCHHPLRVPVPNLFPQPLLPSVALPAHQNKNPPTHSPQILLATNKQSSRWFFCEILLSRAKGKTSFIPTGAWTEVYNNLKTKPSQPKWQTKQESCITCLRRSLLWS